MEEQSKWRLLSKRNILGVVLVAGIGAGLYLGDLWKGFGGGSSLGIGAGDGSSTSTSKSTDGDKGSNSNTNVSIHGDHKDIPESTTATPINAPEVVNVVIADRSYFVRSTDGEKAINLKELVGLVKTAAGDTSGIRVRVYRKQNSRTTTELALRDALIEAGISEDQTVWIANPIE